MTVSVVIPTFNRPESTLKAVRSALDQTQEPDEIIVVDDASKPPFVLSDSSLHDKPIKILTLPTNRGASAARQAGVDAATGDVIAFLDSDDRWLPGKLAAQTALLARSGGDLVAIACGWLEEGSHSRRRVPIPSAQVADFASGCWFAPGSTVILPRTAFAAVGPFDPSLRRLEDLDWFLRFALGGGRLEVAPVTGAVVAIGRRGRGLPVDQASSRLLERFRTQLEPTVLRRLAAYLDLERAAAARNDGRYGAMVLHFVHSFWRSPRPHIPLRRWWVENET